MFITAAAERLVVIAPGKMIRDATGAIRGSWTVDTDGSTALTIHDSEERIRAVLGTTSLVIHQTGEEKTTAESSLVLFDREASVLTRLP